MITNPDAFIPTKAEKDAFYEEFKQYIRDVLSCRELKEEVQNGKNTGYCPNQAPTED